MLILYAKIINIKRKIYMKDNSFAIKINVLVVGIIAIIVLGSQFYQPKASEVAISMTQEKSVEISLEFKQECDAMYNDLEKYVSLAEVALDENNDEKARATYENKIEPKHRNWKRYCHKLYTKNINSKEDYMFLAINTKMNGI